MEEDNFTATHKVSLYWLHCYYNIDTDDLIGVNVVIDYLIPFVLSIHNFIACYFCPEEVDGFPVKILEVYENLEWEDDSV